MANISEKVEKIRSAVYGKDVRESIASGIEAINAESEAAKKSAEQSAASAEKAAEDAEAAISTAATAAVLAETAADKAQTAAENADAATQSAQSAAESAIEASSGAQAAKEAADTAAQAANASKAAADSATNQANTAARSALESTAAADAAAQSAQEATANAQTQGAYAKAQGDRAAQLVSEIENTDVGGMAADILALQTGKADLVNGKVPEDQLPDLNFDPSGSAAAVQARLSAHTGNTANPHNVTAAQLGAVPTTRKVNGLPLSSDINLTPEDIGITAKRTCTYVIGTSAAGWTEADCDFLCDGVDDNSEFFTAITTITNSSYKHGTIKVLPGIYKFTSSIVSFGNISIVGSGKEITVFQIDSWDGFDCPYENKVFLRLLGESKLSHLSIKGPMYSTYAVDLVSDISELDDIEVSSTTGGSVSSFTVNGITGAKRICSCEIRNLPVRVSANSIIENNLFRNTVYVDHGIETPSDRLAETNISNEYTSISNNVFSSLDIANAINVSVCGNRIAGSFHVTNTGAVSIIGNVFGSNGPNIIKAVKCTVSSNVCYNFANYGITINQTTFSVITGNVFVRKEGATSDYSSTQYTIRLTGTLNTKNLISSNLIYGKNYVSDGGTGNTFVNNKYN